MEEMWRRFYGKMAFIELPDDDRYSFLKLLCTDEIIGRNS